jgi:hypothetical protein
MVTAAPDACDVGALRLAMPPTTNLRLVPAVSAPASLAPERSASAAAAPVVVASPVHAHPKAPGLAALAGEVTSNL